jgi:hypothetical protein
VLADLRRPEAWLLDAQGVARWLDHDAVWMPRPDVPAAAEADYFGHWPRLVGGAVPVAQPGQPVADPSLVGAVLIAAEYRTRIRTVLRGAPRLLTVDGTNFGYRLRREPQSAEFRIVVEARDGSQVQLEWGHAPDCKRWQVLPTDVKLEVLRKLLERFPGLEGVAGADLRARNRWLDWVRYPPPAATLDPLAAR